MNPPPRTATCCSCLESPAFSRLLQSAHSLETGPKAVLLTVLLLIFPSCLLLLDASFEAPPHLVERVPIHGLHGFIRSCTAWEYASDYLSAKRCIVGVVEQNQGVTHLV